MKWLYLILGLTNVVGCRDSTSTSFCGGDNVSIDAGVNTSAETAACEAFCAKGHTECELLAGTDDEAQCISGCVQDLIRSQFCSVDCANALRAGFECTAVLSCADFKAWQDKTPAQAYPCRTESMLFSAECEDGP